jgi:uncharacterized membrane protein YwzB
MPLQASILASWYNRQSEAFALQAFRLRRTVRKPKDLQKALAFSICFIRLYCVYYTISSFEKQ